MLSLELWLGFAAAIVILVVLDLGVFTRRQQLISRGEALASFGIWLLATYAVALAIYAVYEQNWLNLQETLVEGVAPILGHTKPNGFDAHFQFLAVYVTEIALSLDNIAVVALLFAYFKVPAAALPRALLWSGIIALIIRLGLVLGGAAMLNTAGLNWTAWIFAALLVIALLRLVLMPDEPGDFSRSRVAAFLRARLRVSGDFHAHRLFTTVNARPAATPLLLAVLVASWIDFTYTADSIPAAFALTRDPFIAFAASAMAILSLRSLFLSLHGFIAKLRYLKPALALIMAGLAVKSFFFIAKPNSLIPAEWMTLGIVVLLLTAILASIQSLKRTDPAALAVPRPAAIADLAEAALATRRNLRKVAILIAGTIVIIVGILIGPLPGPGASIVVPIGIAILATEFAWARTLLIRMKDAVLFVDSISTKLSRSIPPWGVIPLFLAYCGLFYFLYTLNPETWGKFNFIDLTQTKWQVFILFTAFGVAFPFLAFLYRLATGRARLKSRESQVASPEIKTEDKKP
jgi:tellurite resistance protein TerC